MGILRKVMIEARNRISAREERDRIIREVFFKYVPEEVERFFIYANCNGEVDTTKIIEKLLKDGKKVFCPKVISRDMVFFQIHDLSELVPCYHNIPEPVVPEEKDALATYISENSAYPENVPTDLIVVPGLVFDEESGRMGYGSGMYDRYLFKHPCKRLALGYELQVYDNPLELKESDVRMDALITDRKIREW